MELLLRIRNWIKFNLLYLSRPPWDTGISPPELMEFIEQHPPGRALDLGCGTGTNALTLAKNGWEVIGIDFISQAIAQAKRKAQTARLNVDFRVGDATRLEGIEGMFNLILDIGCFHSLGSSGKRSYVENLNKLLAPEGTYMLYTFLASTDSQGTGVKQEEIEFLESNLRLYRRENGTDRGSRRSAWFWFRKDSQH